MSTIIYGSKIIAITGSGIMAGYCIGASFNSIPALLAAGMPAPHLVKAWDGIYESGKLIVVPVVVGGSGSYFVAAYYQSKLSGVRPLTVFGMQNPTQLVLAGSLLLLTAAYTGIVMRPSTIERLKAKLVLVKGLVDYDAVSADVRKWGAQNTLRAAMYTAAFVLGLTAL